MIEVSPKTLPPLGKDGKSVLLLGVVRTPSSKYFCIVYYDSAYKKTQPWRTITNNSVNVTHYTNLPEMP